MFRYLLCVAFALSSSIVSSDEMTEATSKFAAERICGDKDGAIYKRAKYDREIDECKIVFAEIMTQCSNELYPNGALQALSSGVDRSELVLKINDCTGQRFESTDWYKKFVLLRVVNG